MMRRKPCWVAIPLLFPCLVFADCISDAARYHRVDEFLMQAIAIQESAGKSDAINCGNRNKSCDYGLTQTNSIHLNRLSRLGVTKDDLLDPCISAYVGAWILSENIARLGSTWNAVGAYNAREPKARISYVLSIQRTMTKLKSGEISPLIVRSKQDR